MFSVYGEQPTHSLTNLEAAYLKKLGRKRHGPFRDPQKYSKHVSATLPNDEKHLPGYNYCGPGTKVEERVLRGDWGVNKLDNACKEHDVDYMLLADDALALIDADAKLAIAAAEVEHEETKPRPSNMLDSVYNLISLGTYLPRHLKGVVSGRPVPDKAAASIVKNVFMGKNVIEGFGLMDGKKFAAKLSSRTPAEDVALGKHLYNVIDGVLKQPH